jgi:hypothetical protein
VHVNARLSALLFLLHSVQAAAVHAFTSARRRSCLRPRVVLDCMCPSWCLLVRFAFASCGLPHARVLLCSLMWCISVRHLCSRLHPLCHEKLLCQQSQRIRRSSSWMQSPRPRLHVIPLPPEDPDFDPRRVNHNLSLFYKCVFYLVTSIIYVASHRFYIL